MKDKKYYEQKIANAKSQIEVFEARLKALDNPAPLKPTKQATKCMSVRVPKETADKCLLKTKIFLSENNFFQL